MKKVILRVCLFYILAPIVVIGALIAYKAVSFYFGPDSLGPRNAAELCTALGRRDPDSDPLCTYQKLSSLLRDTFPPGEATIDDVHDKLGMYLQNSHEMPIGGTSERYAIRRVLCCWQPNLYMTFNEDGILIDWTYQD